MKVALVHDYLREYGGAERVLEALHEIFPDAPIYVAYYKLDLLGPHKVRVRNWDIKSSFLQNLLFANKFISPLRIFAPMIFESFDLSEFDVVISSSNSYFAKAVKTQKGTLHLGYIHSPPRYLYGFTTSFNYKKHWWTQVAAELVNHLLRLIDFKISQKPDILVANSENVAQRIKKFYRRDSVVIYPPVEIKEFQKVPKQKGGYFLSLGRLVRGKGTEVIVAACSKLNLHLKVVGVGPELFNLKNLAGMTVEFLGEVSDQEKAQIYANAKALIVASEDEDFGITPVESMAAGTPVIALRAGGYLETIVEGKTGEFFEPIGKPISSREYVDWGLVENLVKVLKNFNLDKYNPEFLKEHTEKFSQARFKKEILELVDKNLKG